VAALSAEQFLAAVAEGIHPELDEARRRQRQARETLSILREAAERARGDHADAAAKLRRARGAFERASSASSRASLDEASALLDDFVFDETPKPRDRDELETAIDDLTTRLSHVEQGLQELSSLDPRPIEVLLEAIRNPPEGELVPSEQANQLADEFVALQGRVEALEDALGAGEGGQASALASLETARAELADAERAVAKPELSPADVTELEAAHEAVIEASGKGGRLRRGGAKKLEEAQAAEQSILDRVGFPTWSAYVMGANLLSIDPMAAERLEQARFKVEAAEAHWAQVAAAIEANPEHRALLDRLEAVYLAAFDLLGGDDEAEDLEAALRAVRVPKAEVSQEDLVDALAYQLELVGLDLGTTTPGVDLVLLAADAFLAEVRAVSDRVAELGRERDELQVELADARHELEQVAAAEAAAAAAAEPTIDLTDRATGTEVVDDAPSMEQLQAELAQTEEAEREAAESLDARLALLDATTQVEAVASSRVMRIATALAAAGAAPTDDMLRPASDPAFDVDPDEQGSTAESIEFYLLARLAQQRAVSFSGSAPMLFDDAFTGLDRRLTWSLLDKLERMAESVQLILVSDDGVVAEWAASAGIQRAAVVSPTTQFA
jgi:hypothetical protein